MYEYVCFYKKHAFTLTLSLFILELQLKTTITHNISDVTFQQTIIQTDILYIKIA